MDVSKYRTRIPPKEHEEAVRMLLEGLDKQAPKSDLKEIAASKERANEVNRMLDQTFTSSRLSPRSAVENTRKPHQRRQQYLMSNRSMNKSQRQAMSVEEKECRSHSKSSSVDSGSLAQGPEDEYEDFDLEQLNESNNKRDLDQLDFNSEESSSQDFIQVSPQITSRRLLKSPYVSAKLNQQQKLSLNDDEQLIYEKSALKYPLPKMQSKATSTASDSVSTSGTSACHAADDRRPDEQNDLNGNYEAIPNRTIAIQCDLRLSSTKKKGYLDSASTDLASMQASSISSTRYGFYKLSPEVLEQRRQLARSVSSRNIAGLQASPMKRQNVAEAPTSMSECSSAADDIDEFDPELDRIRRKSLPLEESHERQSLVSTSDKESLSTNRNKRDQRFFSQRREQANSRTHRDSLPRRPKTALSYVSTSRLRGQSQGESGADELTSINRSPSDDEEEDLRHTKRLGHVRRTSPRSRAMSHQALSSSGVNRRSTFQETEGDLLSSNSDSELASVDKYRVPHQEEILVTRRGRTMGSSPQVSRSQNFKNGPMFKRSATLTGTPSVTTATTTTMSTRTNDYNKDVATRENALIHSKPTKKSHHQHHSYSTDEENQLATSRRLLHTRLNTAANSLGQSSRYSSMSLSRRPQQLQQSLNEERCCDLTQQYPVRSLNNNDVELAGGLMTETDMHNHRQQIPPTQATLATSRAILSRHERSGNQQNPATSARSAMKASSVLANARNQPQIGRSTSMKQSRSRFSLSSGGGSTSYAQEPAVYTTPNAIPVEHRQRRYYDSNQCEYDNFCETVDQTVGHANEYESELAGLQTNEGGQTLPAKRSESEDSESPLTRTWANPANSTRRPPTWRLNNHHHQSSYNLTNPTKNGSIRMTSRANNHDAPAVTQQQARSLTRKTPRSHSMRDVNNLEANGVSLAGTGRARRLESIHRAGQQQEGEEYANGTTEHQQNQRNEMPAEEFSICSSSASLDDGGPEVLTRAQASHQPLDFDSQQRLNEIGLPEPSHHSISSASGPKSHAHVTSSASQLGLASGPSAPRSRYATTGHGATAATASHHYPSLATGPAITGRAMSQQSLTRPTMPLSRRLRRSGGSSGGAGSGSDVGGSSMSLVSRLRDGSRYENAHTRTPVVMLIPQATGKQNDPSTRLTGALGSRRGSSSRLGRPLARTTGSRVSSQDRSRKSLSRNGSDSESSSSMLRTLVKPRPNANRAGMNNRSGRRRAANNNVLDSDEENMDGIGQLATEMDSYKFRRRYSVPKDAKINWFSKLKQKVTSSKN